MIKRFVLGTLLVGLIGVLIAGAIIRTVDKTENVAEARGQGRGQAEAGTGVLSTDDLGQGNAVGRQGNRQAGGYGQSATGGERQYPNYEELPEDWNTYEGTVIEVPESDGDLVMAADDGQEITVGTGPGYMETQGFALQAGERVQVYGYWEDGEFKAAQLTRLRDGQTISLRDELGRPAWAGNGNRASEQQAVAPGGGRGQGQGGQGQGGGQSGYSGQGGTDAPGDGTGTGQAQVDEWLTLQGTVLSVDSDALVVQTGGGEQVTVENRPWWFAQEQGFSVQIGEQVTLTGFYEDGEFEVGRIDNLSSGATVEIREDSGRPLWAGRGRRGG